MGLHHWVGFRSTVPDAVLTLIEGSPLKPVWCFMWLWIRNNEFRNPLNLEHKTFIVSQVSSAWPCTLSVTFIHFTCLSSSSHVHNLKLSPCVSVWPAHLNLSCLALLSNLFTACFLVSTNFLHENFHQSNGPLRKFQNVLGTQPS